MAKPRSQLVVAVLAVLTLAAGATLVADADAPAKRRGQEVHLFEVTVRLVEGADEYYNFRLLAAVLGSVEAARSATFETEPGSFSAFLTNNQARRLTRVPGVLEVRQRDDPVPTEGQ